jgi:hypothetical protein
LGGNLPEVIGENKYPDTIFNKEEYSTHSRKPVYVGLGTWVVKHLTITKHRVNFLKQSQTDRLEKHW